MQKIPYYSLHYLHFDNLILILPNASITRLFPFLFFSLYKNDSILSVMSYCNLCSK